MPEKSIQLTYSARSHADNFELWSKYTPSNRTAYELTMKHFGSVVGKSVVDFGCGNGLFLKTCLENGASKVMGLDKSSFMIESARENAHGSTLITTYQSANFVVHDCYSNYDDAENVFDLACSHYALQYSSTFDEFETYVTNMYNSLKENGMAIICMPRMAKNEIEQKNGAEVFGFLIPLEKDFPSIEEPVRWSMDFLKPDTVKGEGFLNESWCSITEYRWSEKMLIKTMHAIGFTEVELFDPKIKLSKGKSSHGHSSEFACCCLFAVGKK